MADIARTYDIVLYGASGFVGRCAGYLAETAPPGTRIALGGPLGRALRRRPGLAAGRGRGWALVPADASDAPALHGSPRDPGARHHGGTLCPLRAARGRGLRGPGRTTPISPARCCSSATHRPVDDVARDRRADRARLRVRLDAVGPAVQLLPSGRRPTEGRCDHAAGGARGGSAAARSTRCAPSSRRAGGPARRRVVGDPFALSPDRAAEPEPASPGRRAARAATAGRPVDGAVRDGAVQHPDRPAQQRAAGLGLRPRTALRRGDGVRRGRRRGDRGRCHRRAGRNARRHVVRADAWLLDRVLPAPGTGPSEEARAKGWFRMVVDARRRAAAATGRPWRDRATPATPRPVMLGETALALALDEERLPRPSRVAHPGHRDGRRAGGAAARRRAHLRGGPDRHVTVSPPGRRAGRAAPA